MIERYLVTIVSDEATMPASVDEQAIADAVSGSFSYKDVEFVTVARVPEGAGVPVESSLFTGFPKEY